MRTTLAIDDDVLATAREMAQSERKSVGEVIWPGRRCAPRSLSTPRATACRCSRCVRERRA